MGIERMTAQKGSHEAPENLPVVDKELFEAMVGDNTDAAPLTAANLNETPRTETLSMAKDRALELIEAMKKQGVPMTKQVMAGIGRLAMKVAKDPKRSTADLAKFGGKIVWGVASYKGMRDAWREAGAAKDTAKSFDHITKGLLKTRHRLFSENVENKSETKAEMNALLGELRELNQSLPKKEADEQRKILADILAENRTRKAELRDSDQLPTEALQANLKTIEEGIERSKKLLVKEKRLEATAKGVGTSILYLGLATGGLGAGVGVSARAGADSLKRSVSLERKRHKEHAKAEEDKTKINAKTILVDGVKETLVAARKGDTDAIVKSLSYAIGVGFAADRVLGDDSIKEAAHDVFNELVGVNPALGEGVEVGVGAADDFLEMLGESGEAVGEQASESPADAFLKAVEESEGGGVTPEVDEQIVEEANPVPEAGSDPDRSDLTEDLSAPEMNLPVKPIGISDELWKAVHNGELGDMPKEFSDPEHFNTAKVIFTDTRSEIAASIISRMMPNNVEAVAQILSLMTPEAPERVEAILDSLPPAEADSLREMLHMEEVTPEIVPGPEPDTPVDSDISGIQTEIEKPPEPSEPVLEKPPVSLDEPPVSQTHASIEETPASGSDPLTPVHEAPLSPLQMQNIEVPSGKGNSLSEAFYAAWKAGQIKGLPEMTNGEFINKMYEAIHALDNHSVVMEAMQDGITDLDEIQPGTMNVQPLVDYINGQSVEEIEGELAQHGFTAEALLDVSNLPELIYSVAAGDPGVSYRLLDEYPEIFGGFSEDQWNEFITSVNNDPELLQAAHVDSGDLNKIFAGNEIRLDLLAKHGAEMQGLAAEAVPGATPAVVHLPVQSVESEPAVNTTTLEESVDRLSRLYADSPPAEAAQALSSMESETAASLIDNMSVADGAEILSEMTPDDAAEIIANLEPDKAEAVTRMMSESVVVSEPEAAASVTPEPVPEDPAAYIAENWPAGGFTNDEEAKRFLINAGIANEHTEVTLKDGVVRLSDAAGELHHPALTGGAENMSFYKTGQIKFAWVFKEGKMLTHSEFTGGAEAIYFYEDGSLEQVIAAEGQLIRHPGFGGEGQRLNFYANGKLSNVEGHSITHPNFAGEAYRLEFYENGPLGRAFAEDLEQGLTHTDFEGGARMVVFYEDGSLAYADALKDEVIIYKGISYEALSLYPDGSVNVEESELSQLAEPEAATSPASEITPEPVPEAAAIAEAGEVEPEPISSETDRSAGVAGAAPVVPGPDADDMPKPSLNPLREGVPEVNIEKGPLADLPNYTGAVEADVELPNVIDGYLISDNLLEAGLDSQTIEGVYGSSDYWGVDQMSGELRSRQLAELSELMSERDITDPNEVQSILSNMLRRDAMILNSFVLEGERSVVTEKDLTQLLKTRDMIASRFYAWPDNLEPYASDQLTVGEAIERNLNEQRFNPTKSQLNGKILEYIVSP